MLHQLGLLVSDRSFIAKVVSVKFDPLRPSKLPSVKFNLLLNWSGMNDLVGGVDLRFYRGV
jgi:hypothetical protein